MRNGWGRFLAKFSQELLLLVFRLGAFKKRAESGKAGAQRQGVVLAKPSLGARASLGCLGGGFSVGVAWSDTDALVDSEKLR